MPGMPATPGMPGMPAMPGMPSAPGGGSTTLTVGAPPQTLDVPAPPSFTLTLTEAGEYQIDAMASPADVELHVYQGDDLVASDRDGGEGSDARLVEFLQPGTYALRVFEYRAQPMTVRMQAQKLPPLTASGTLVPGQPSVIQTSEGPDVRTSCRELTLNVTTPGNYQLDAVGAGTADAEMMLIQNNAKLEQNDDGGGGRNAQIRRALTPGAYTVRVWEHAKQAGSITVTATAT